MLKLLLIFYSKQTPIVKIMDEFKSTLIQHKHPKMRRKNASMIDNFLKQTFANSFLAFIDQAQMSDKPSLKQSEEMIQTHYKKLHGIIDSIDQHLTRRLQNHENQVFSIVKAEIESMREETRLIVEKLNAAIKQKNIEDEIWQLNNELDYFKSQTYKLFQQNKKLREDMKILKNQVKEAQIQLQNSDKVMQKLKHDCMKAKISRNKLSKTLKQKESEISKSPLAKEISLVSLQQKKQMKTDYSQLKDHKMAKDIQIGYLPKQSIVNIQMPNQQPPIITINGELDQTDPLSHDLIFESISLYRKESDNGLPKVSLKKVISQISQEKMSHEYFVQKMSQHSQTDPINIISQQRQENIFSKTSCFNDGSVKNQKQIDLLKSGFYVRSYNGTKLGGMSDSKVRKESQKLRYMNLAFNNNKIQNEKDQRQRIKTTVNVFQNSRFK